jgi:carboxyl-terminal processing protease
MGEFFKTRAPFFAAVVLVAIGSFTIGVYAGQTGISEVERATGVINKTPNSAAALGAGDDVADFEPFWKVWNLINEKYVPANGDATNQDKVWGAISGLLGSLDDPYTVFLPPDDSAIFEENISGSFGGVGMEIGMRDGVLTVISPLAGTPAEAAGIRAGDRILMIDEESTRNMSVDKAVSLIRGEIGTRVTLELARPEDDEVRTVTVVRATIQIPTINTTLRDDGIFVIELYNFSGNSQQLFENAIREFQRSGARKLILDLRNNPGGYLGASIDMASWFLPAGKPVVIEDFGTSRDNKVYRSYGYDLFARDPIDMVILINGGSASASEILAGALSEHGVATLVGKPTFGKGSVQELVRVTPDTSLKVTVAQWRTPNGLSFSKGGLEPDHEVEMTLDDIDQGRDPQMERAIELLLDGTGI